MSPQISPVSFLFGKRRDMYDSSGNWDRCDLYLLFTLPEFRSISVLVSVFSFISFHFNTYKTLFYPEDTDREVSFFVRKHIKKFTNHYDYMVPRYSDELKWKRRKVQHLFYWTGAYLSPTELVNDLWFYWVCYVDLMVIDTADSFHDVESWLGVSVNEQLVFLKKLLKWNFENDL